MIAFHLSLIFQNVLRLKKIESYDHMNAHQFHLDQQTAPFLLHRSTKEADSYLEKVLMENYKSEI